MHRRRSLQHLAMLFTLASCGGSPPGPLVIPPYPAVAIEGDSATAGGRVDGGTLSYISPLPTEMMNASGPVLVYNRGENGVALAELLAGGPVAAGLAVGQTTVALATRLLTEPAPVIMIGCGHVDALFTAINQTDFIGLMDTAMNTIVAAGKTPCIRGMNNFLVNGTVSAGMLDRVHQFGDASRDYAALHGIKYIEIPQEATLGLDGLHPDIVYHWVIARAIADQLREFAL